VGPGLTPHQVTHTKQGNKVRVMQRRKAMTGFDWGHPVVLSNTNIE